MLNFALSVMSFIRKCLGLLLEPHSSYVLKTSHGQQLTLECVSLSSVWGVWEPPEAECCLFRKYFQFFASAAAAPRLLLAAAGPVPATQQPVITVCWPENVSILPSHRHHHYHYHSSSLWFYILYRHKESTELSAVYISTSYHSKW